MEAMPKCGRPAMAAVCRWWTSTVDMMALENDIHAARTCCWAHVAPATTGKSFMSPSAARVGIGRVRRPQHRFESLIWLSIPVKSVEAGAGRVGSG